MIKQAAEEAAKSKDLKKLEELKGLSVGEEDEEVGFAVEAVVPKHTINTLIPALKDHGATDIIELPISKIVP